MSFNVSFKCECKPKLKLLFFLFFTVYFYLFTHFSFIFIDCHRFNFRLKRLTSGIDLFIFSFQGWKCLKTYKDLINIINVLLHDREERVFGSAIK